jgi:Ca2+-transporting ATPase
MLLAALVGLPLPLLPIQLLWVNLATDGLPALALVVDPVSPDALKRPPRRPDEPILGREEWIAIAFTGVIQTAATLGTFAWALRSRNLAEARNLAFTVLVFGELFRAFAARSPTRLFWEMGVFTNVTLLGVVLVSALVQIGIHHIPGTERLFQIGTISMEDCALSVLIGLIPVSVVECTKLVRRAAHRATSARAGALS